MTDSYKQLIEKLDAFIRKYYKNLLIRGAIYAFALSLAFYLLIISLEYFNNFNTGIRTALFYGFVVGFLFILGKFIAIPLAHLYRIGKVISHEQAAQIIGTHFVNVKDKLLNVLQLKKLREGSKEQQPWLAESNDLLDAGIDQKIKELQPIPFVSAINISENKRYLRYAMLPLLALVLILFTAPSLIKDSTKRLISHGTYFEKPAPFSFKVLNKTLKGIQQQDFQLDIKIDGNEIPVEAFIEIGDNQFRLEKEKLGSFHYTFKNLQRTESFRLFADGFYSEEFTLEALPNPVLMSFRVDLNYPSYINKLDETLQNTGDLVIPAGTKVRWTFNTQNTEHIKMIF